MVKKSFWGQRAFPVALIMGLMGGVWGGEQGAPKTSSGENGGRSTATGKQVPKSAQVVAFGVG
jgi:hypothetical protein